MTCDRLGNAPFRDGRSKKRSQRGITLIEVLASILVIGIGLLGVLAVIPYGAFQISEARRTDYAVNMLANAAAEVGLRRMTSPGTWNPQIEISGKPPVNNILTSGGCPQSFFDKIEHWVNTPGTPIPDGAEQYLVFAKRNGNIILNVDKIIWVEPCEVADPAQHIFRVGSTFRRNNGNKDDWKELMRGQDDLDWKQNDGERPNPADAKSSGNYTWFFTFQPGIRFDGRICDIDPTSLHFGSFGMRSIRNSTNPFHLTKEINNPAYDPTQPVDPDTNPKKITVNCYEVITNPGYDPNSPVDSSNWHTKNVDCPPFTPFHAGGTYLRLIDPFGNETQLREAKSLLINQGYYSIKNIKKTNYQSCDSDCNPQILEIEVSPWSGILPVGLSLGNPNNWYIPRQFRTLTDTDITVDVLACWRRVPEDDVQVPAESFTKSQNGGCLTFSNADHLEKLTQTKYVFVTWDTTSVSDGITRANGAWCKIVFLDKSGIDQSGTGKPKLFVTGKLDTCPGQPHVYIPNGVMFHTQTDSALGD